MDSEEEKRKANQRKIQKAVIELKNAGNSKKEIKEAVKVLKRKLNKRPKPKSKKIRRDQVFKELTDEKMRLGRKHQLIIIPIFWKAKEEETSETLDLCNWLKDQLVRYKINVWIDLRKSLKPAQKYQYWEEIGCKFRAEIGPKEARNRTVCISKFGTGIKQKSRGEVLTQREVAKRWHGLSIKTSAEVLEIAKLLKEQGLEYINLDVEKIVAKETVAIKKQIDISGDSLDVNYVIE